MAHKNEILLNENQNNIQPVSMSIASITSIPLKTYDKDDYGDHFDALNDYDNVEDNFSDKEAFINDNKADIKPDQDLIKISFRKELKIKKMKSFKAKKTATSRNKTGKTYMRTGKKASALIKEMIKELKADPLDPELRLDCPQCEKKNFKKSALQTHLKLVHKSPDIKCQYEGCDWKFKRIGDYRRHYENHFREKELCTLCGFSFKNLEAHIKQSHSESKFNCQYCGKEYCSDYGLKYHIETVHNNKKKSVCHICAKVRRRMAGF